MLRVRLAHCHALALAQHQHALSMLLNHSVAQSMAAVVRLCWHAAALGQHKLVQHCSLILFYTICTAQHDNQACLSQSSQPWPPQQMSSRLFRQRVHACSVIAGPGSLS